ncbi:MAG: hypothetical protein LBG22_06200 [Treponema sp.]|nr:hypothetical protein [Treponema sp.]
MAQSAEKTYKCNRLLGRSGVEGIILMAGFKSSVIMSAVAGAIVRDLVLCGRCGYDLSPFTSQISCVE